MPQQINKITNWFFGTSKQLMGALGFSGGKTTKEELSTIAAVTTPSVDYSTKTVVQLKTIAKDRGLKGYSSLKKAELIELLNN
jgi:hypothetical protein